MRVTLILPPLEYFIGHLSGKTGVERNGREFLSADTAFSQRQYFRMINLPLAVQNGCEWTGGGWGRGLNQWSTEKSMGLAQWGIWILALVLPLTICIPCYTQSPTLCLHPGLYLPALKVYDYIFGKCII